MQIYDLFYEVLAYIEQNLHYKLKAENIAEQVGYSATHLQRVFKFAFHITIAEYIRKRKLASSLNELVHSNMTILDIALMYGFEYEQSFTRAFKAEYRMTPGEYRKQEPIVNIVLPFQIMNQNRTDNGLLFEPEIVMMPEIIITGIEKIIPCDESLILAPEAAIDFWDNHKNKIVNGTDYNTFYGLTHHLDDEYRYTTYLPSIATKSDKEVPEGMKIEKFGGFPCVKFHYIGNHSNREISLATAKNMYDAIGKYMNSNSFYSINYKIHLEKILDMSAWNNEWCLMEWYSPAILR